MKIIQTLHKLKITLVLKMAFFMHHRNRVLLINIRGHIKNFLAEIVWKKMNIIFIKTFILKKLEKVCMCKIKTSFWPREKKMSTGKVRCYDA